MFGDRNDPGTKFRCEWLFERRTVPGKEIGIGQLYPLIEWHDETACGDIVGGHGKPVRVLGEDIVLYRKSDGAVASAFGAAALEVGPEIDTGVPVLIFDGKPRLAFALKSGNFGADDFFERALDTLKGRAS